MPKVRVEFLVIGCTLIVIGLVLVVLGHARIETGPAGEGVSLLGNLANAAPADEKDAGYLMMGIGAFLVVAGIWLCAASRPVDTAASR